MERITTLEVGDEVKLGSTTYKVIAPLLDKKNKPVSGSWIAQPCAWDDMIMSQPEEFRKHVQKTEPITIVLPLNLWDHATTDQ